MKTIILQGIEGARRAAGLIVVIDVFRAFTTALHVAAGGASRIIPVADEATARRFKEADPAVVLMGERGCMKLPGFDYGNSPAQVEGVDFTGRTVVHTTSAGTQGLAAALLESEADEVITGSFANAGAVVKRIRARQPEIVCLVAMGTAGVEPSPEDTMCAFYLKNELEDYPNRFEALDRFLRTVPSARKFTDPSMAEHAPARDLDLCLTLDQFDFVLRAYGEADGEMELVREEPEAA